MPLQDVLLTGDRIQFSVEWCRNNRMEVSLFNGRIHGNTMEGRFQDELESKAGRNVWKAERDPSTAEPLDVFYVINP